MTTEFSHALPRWSIGVPIAAVVALAIVWNRPLGSALIVVVALALIAAVLAAVHHAEVVALRVGEPFGTLILAVAVTIIEVGLIVSVMLAGGPTATVVARDAVYAAVMITSTGIIGVCLLVGGLRHRELDYRVEGTSPALAVLAALAVLTLVVPAYTTTHARSFVFDSATGVRGCDVAGAVLRFRVRANGATSRLFLTGRCWRPSQSRGAAAAEDRARELRIARGQLDRRRRSRKIARAVD